MTRGVSEATKVVKAEASGPWWRVAFRSRSPVKNRRRVLTGIVVVGPATTRREAVKLARAIELPAHDSCSALELPANILRLIDDSWRGRWLPSDEAYALERRLAKRLGEIRGQDTRPMAHGKPKLAEPHSDLAERAALRTQLAPKEESPLVWYYSEGATIAERSTAGPLLQNHGAYSEDAIKYENDLRAGRKKLPKNESFERRGWPQIEYGRPGREAIYDDRGIFTGEYEDTRVPLFKSNGEILAFPDDQETAEITSEYISPTRSEPVGEEIVKAADISHVLNVMVSSKEHDGRTAVQVLAKVYGPDGQHWHTLQQSGDRVFRPHGRIAALYETTEYGRRLIAFDDELRRASGAPPSEQKQLERMIALVQFSVAAIGGEWKKPSRGEYKDMKRGEARALVRSLLSAARDAAELGYWSACHAWRAALRSDGAKVMKPGR